MATDGQKKEIFDKLKIVVGQIINDNLFATGITGEEFYNKFISKLLINNINNKPFNFFSFDKKYMNKY